MNPIPSSDVETDASRAFATSDDLPEDELIALPTSFAQQRLWLVDQLDPGSAVYNIPFAVRLRGQLDVAALEESLNTIVRRHEVLRTTFRSIDGEPVQVIATELAISLAIVDLTTWPETEREAAADALAHDEASRPFDLAHDPLLRVSAIRTAADDHLLLLTMHHIISDGWSMELLFQELAALYAARLRGEIAAMPDLTIQYADYAIWQREMLQGEALQQQIDYWRDALAGAPDVLDLPTDRPRPTVQRFRGTQHAFELSRPLTEAIERFARLERATPFMVHLAAFAALLHVYTDRDDITIGAPVANRDRPELESLLGFFVNTLALRADLSGDPTFRTLLARIRERTLDAYAHQELPFDKLVEVVQPTRSLSHTPIFQVMFAYHQASATPTLPGLSTRVVETHNGTAPFELDLTLTETADGLDAVLVYNTDLFEAATVARIAEQYRHLLEGIVSAPDRRLSALPIVTPVERAQLARWNATAADFPADATIHGLFEEQAARTPDAVAVLWGDQELTYRELNERANQLAHFLRHHDVGPDSLVGICAEPSLELAIALLGVLKAGGAYVPLDPTYPRERLAYMLSDSGVSLVLTRAEEQWAIPDSDAPVVRLDADWALIAAEPRTNPTPLATADNLVYVIYTSGSTGKPKGVLIQHRGLVSHGVAWIRHFDLSPADRMLQFASISFDAAAEEIYPTWLCGATLVMRPKRELTTIPDFLDLVDRQHVTAMELPTAFWHEWVAEIIQTGAPVPPSVRLVIVGGEKAQMERIVAWHRLVRPGIRWSDTYGPTEVTITSTIYEPSDGQAIEEANIGRPVDNLRLYVVDHHLNEVPIGVPGELLVGGVGVARGYLNRPELTAERFVPDPFSGEPGSRLYRTGDLVRFRPDGTVDFLGRIDFQVKIRGFRIELGEIESALTRHPAVRQVVVTVRDDVAGDPRLVAYLLEDGTPLPTPAELRQFLQESIPAHMIPAAFVGLDCFPLTPSGKVDRRALPAPIIVSEAAESRIAPRSTTEQMLADIWAELLGIEAIGVDDSFFDLGGHSLLATRLISRARERFGVEIRLRDLFAGPTIAELATVIDTATLLSASASDLDAMLALLEESV